MDEIASASASTQPIEAVPSPQDGATAAEPLLDVFVDFLTELEELARRFRERLSARLNRVVATVAEESDLVAVPLPPENETHPASSILDLPPLDDIERPASATAPSTGLPPRLADPSVPSHLAAQLADSAWQEALGRLGYPTTPEAEARALASLLRSPPTTPSAALQASVTAWLKSHSDEAGRVGLRLVSPAELSEEELPRLAVATECPEVPGIRLGPDLLLPPLLPFPDTPGGRLALLWWPHPPADVRRLDLLDLAAGRPTRPLLPALLELFERPADPAGVAARSLLKPPLVREVDVPSGPDDPRFEVMYTLYRGFNGVLQVLRPALLVEGDAGLLRPGLIQMSTVQRPTPEKFMEVEKAALLEEMSLFPGPFQAVDGQSIRPTSADLPGKRLDARMLGMSDALSRNDKRNIAFSFAQFVQDVLNVFVPEGDFARRWRERQRKFRQALMAFLPELGLVEEAIPEGEPYNSYTGKCSCIPFQPAQRELGARPNKILQVLAPALKYRADGHLLRGTLLYLKS